MTNDSDRVRCSGLKIAPGRAPIADSRKHIAAQLVADLMIAFAIQNKGELFRQWANPETQIVEVNLIDIQPSSATDL